MIVISKDIPQTWRFSVRGPSVSPMNSALHLWIQLTPSRYSLDIVFPMTPGCPITTAIPPALSCMWIRFLPERAGVIYLDQRGVIRVSRAAAASETSPTLEQAGSQSGQQKEETEADR